MRPRRLGWPKVVLLISRDTYNRYMSRGIDGRYFCFYHVFVLFYNNYMYIYIRYTIFNILYSSYIMSYSFEIKLINKIFFLTKMTFLHF